MIRGLGNLLSRLAGRYMPEPFTIALALTLVTFLVAAVSTPKGLMELLGFWGGRLDGETVMAKEKGFWMLIAFAMQMCLILVTGFALASTPLAKRAISWLAERPRTGNQAIAGTAVIAMMAAYINWGLGLIVGALLARDVARACRRQGIPVHYPLLGAAGYTGLMVWHGGFSGSAPFKVTQAKDVAELLPGVDIGVIPLEQTILSPLNLTIAVLMFVLVPLILVRMSPPPDEVRPIQPGQGGEEEGDDPRDDAELTPASRLERSPILAWILGGAALIYLYAYLSKIGFNRADLNAINLFFLALGLILHGSPIAYGRAVGRAAGGCAGIILQFPFYAGIMGLMKQSGLMEQASNLVAEVATKNSFEALTFLSAGLVNLFVPSGGGQWGVQGSIVMQSAQALDVPLGNAVMAFSYGDGWTNMLQPFWALPLLAITGLKARELVGYTAALMFLVGPVIVLCLTLF